MTNNLDQFSLTFAAKDSYRTLLDRLQDQNLHDLYSINGGTIRDQFKFYDTDLKAATGQVLSLLVEEVSRFPGLADYAKAYRTGAVMPGIVNGFNNLRTTHRDNFIMFWEQLESETVQYTGTQMSAAELNVRLSLTDPTPFISRIHKLNQDNFSQHYRDIAKRLEPFCIYALKEAISLLTKLCESYNAKLMFRPTWAMAAKSMNKAQSAATRGNLSKPRLFAEGGGLVIDSRLSNLFGEQYHQLFPGDDESPEFNSSLYWDWYLSGSNASIRFEDGMHLELAPSIFPPFLIQRAREEVPMFVEVGQSTIMFNDSVHLLNTWPSYQSLPIPSNEVWLFRTMGDLLASIAWGLTLISFTTHIGQGSKRSMWHTSPMSVEVMRIFPRYIVRSIETARQVVES